jgi:hypothetical protein
VNRIVADSNILTSALLRGGKPFELLEFARAGQIELAVSDATLDETGRVLKTKFKVPDETCRSSSGSSRDSLGTSSSPTARSITPSCNGGDQAIRQDCLMT